MTSNIDLDDYAAGAVQDAIYDMRELDIKRLREAVRDHAYDGAESACTYYADCMDIISRYEGEPEAADAADLCLDGRYTAAQWQEAMVAYAAALASCVVSSRAERLVDAIEKARGTIFDAATMHGAPEDGCEKEPRIGRGCPHGWAVHDREDADGVHYWSEPELEGCRAVAVRASGVWLSHTWTPAEVVAEATSGGGA